MMIDETIKVSRSNGADPDGNVFAASHLKSFLCHFHSWLKCLIWWIICAGIWPQSNVNWLKSLPKKSKGNMISVLLLEHQGKPLTRECFICLLIHLKACLARKDKKNREEKRHSWKIQPLWKFCRSDWSFWSFLI